MNIGVPYHSLFQVSQKHYRYPVGYTNIITTRKAYKPHLTQVAIDFHVYYMQHFPFVAYQNHQLYNTSI